MATQAYKTLIYDRLNYGNMEYLGRNAGKGPNFGLVAELQVDVVDETSRFRLKIVLRYGREPLEMDIVAGAEEIGSQVRV